MSECENLQMILVRSVQSRLWLLGLNTWGGEWVGIKCYISSYTQNTEQPTCELEEDNEHYSLSSHDADCVENNML